MTSKLLQCPSALKACQMRNSNNLTPAEIAYHSNHSDIGEILDDFQRLCESEKINLSHECEPIFENELTDQEKANLRIKAQYRHTSAKLTAAHHQLYGMPFSPDFSQLKGKDKFFSSMKNNNTVHDESIYSQMSNFQKQNIKNELDFNKMNRLETSDKNSTIPSKVEQSSQIHERDPIKRYDNSEISIRIDKNPSDTASTVKSSSDLNDIHKELLYIIETFKKGMSFEKFESLFQNWQSKYQNILSGNLSKEMNDSLSQIQTLCKIGRKQQKLQNNSKQTFSFSDLRYYLTSKLHNRANNNTSKVYNL